MNSNTTLFFVLLNKQLTAWLATPAQATRQISIHGDLSARIEQAQALLAASTDVNERLQGEGQSGHMTHWILDSEGLGLWGGVAADLQQQPSAAGGVQALSWAWLATRFGIAIEPRSADKHTLTQLIFPWLTSADDAAERQQMHEALAREHDTEAGRLAAERAQLQQDNERLRAINVALQQVDTENLLRFLPALYPRIFTAIGATDLALLCGRVEPLAIENPYPEPSEETLRVLQKDFRHLPGHLQLQIVEFVKRLPQRQKIQPRPEMRDLVADLERR
jgi:hypothetical protein